MNYTTKTPQFKEYEEATGNTFAAIKYVAQLARKKCEENYHCITEAQAVAWVSTGIEPKEIQEHRIIRAQRKQRMKTYVEDRISDILDEDIRGAVRETIKQSRSQQHLIYCYEKVWDLNKQARVRILSNMIWDELRQLDAEGEIVGGKI